VTESIRGESTALNELTTLPDMRAWTRAQRGAGRRIGLVPTMGYLHEGHLALVDEAKRRTDAVVLSIFVNPLQFGPNEDYARYPRPLEDDLQVCEADGVDIVLVPSVTELYPAGRQVTVDAGALGSVLEGHSRPGHFNGVLTVVLKLFNIIRPQVAVFGEKDAQQLACIQRMVIDFNLAVEIVGAPIVREPDGLALSSRNVFLSASERAVARSLSAALEKAATQGSVRSARAAAYEVLDRAEAEPCFELDYATIVNPATFTEVPDDHVGLAIFVVAARIGGTRLIDNTTINFTPAPWG
jgi:pantoate--beta-alanine ligase